VSAAARTSVILTRPQGKNETLAHRLAAVDLPALVIPALQIEPLRHDPATFPLPGDYDLIIFVSGHASQFYFAELAARGMTGLWPGQTLAATVGVSSARQLQVAGQIPPTHILHPGADAAQDSESLWNVLAPRLATMRRVLIVRGGVGREWLGRKLEEAGLTVRRLAVYARKPAHWTAQQAAPLAQALSAQACVCLLTSIESVVAVNANMMRLGLADAWSHARFVVIHERVASRLQSIRKASGKVETPMVKICQPSDDAIFQSITLMASLSESS